MNTFCGAVLRAFCAALGMHGVDVDALLSEVGLARRTITEGEGRVPVSAALTLFERAPALTGDPAFGVNVGVGMPVGMLPALDWAVRSSRDAREALRRVARYYAFVDDGCSLRFEERGRIARLSIEHRPEPRIPPAGVELCFAMIVARGRELTKSSMPLVEVTFAHEHAGDRGPYQRLFGGVARFGEPCDSVVVEREWLDTPIVATPEGATNGELDRLTVSTLRARPGRELPEGEPASERVRRAVASSMRGDEPTLGALAERLGSPSHPMGERELRAMLAALGTTHGDVVEETRRLLAEAMLTKTSLIPSEVGYLAGFSSPAAFTRAFERWTGKRPSVWRSAPRALARARLRA